MRVGIGCMMVLHGYPKMLGGPEKWEKIGHAVSLAGIDGYFTFWGFMAAFAEAIGGILLVLGFLFRPAALLLLITMIVASMKHLDGGDGISGASHAVELAFVFLGMFILGPGKYSIDKS
ncbi:MAG: DoxX family protein [Chitinophagales bacterium]|nr:DoxX family protein [Chitinophagales bacterium]